MRLGRVDLCGMKNKQHEDELFRALSRDADMDWVFIAVDSGGLPVYYELSCGNTYDIVHAESLVANCPTSNIVVADYYERNIYKYLL